MGRTMEDASAMDLDWFWRGWFYTTDVTDIGIKGVKKFYTKKSNNSVEFVQDETVGLGFENTQDKYHYEITYNDGTKERKMYPAEIWRYNDKEVTKVFSSSKQIKKIEIDPDLETADVDTSNNKY